MRSTFAHPGVDEFDQFGTDGNKPVVAELAYGYAQPVGHLIAARVMSCDHAAGIEAAQLTRPKPALQQHAIDRTDAFERYRQPVTSERIGPQRLEG